MDVADSAEVQTLRAIGRAIRERQFAGNRRRLTRIYHALSVAMGYSEWGELCRQHPSMLRERMARLKPSHRGFPAAVGPLSKALHIDLGSAVALFQELVEPAIAEFESGRCVGVE